MQVYEEISPGEGEAELLEAVRAQVKRPGVSLVMAQAVVCLIILLAALLLKFILPDLYTELRGQYDAEMKHSILITYDDVSDT